MAKVKSKKCFESIFEGDEEVGKYLILEMLYSKDEQLLHKKEYDDEEKVVAEMIFTYDQEQLIEVHNINSFEGIDQRTKFEYEDQRLTKMIDAYNAKDFIETIYTYNDEGNLLQVVKTDNEGESHGKVLYEYDPVERVTRETHFNGADEESYELETTDDEHGRQIEVIERHFKGADNYTEKIETHTFDEAGQRVSVEISYEEELVFKLENERDEDGRLIGQIKHDVAADLESLTTFSLDEKGRRTKEEELHDGELFRTKEIQYDAHDEIIDEKSFTKINHDFFNADRKTYEVSYFEAS